MLPSHPCNKMTVYSSSVSKLLLDRPSSSFPGGLSPTGTASHKHLHNSHYRGRIHDLPASGADQYNPFLGSAQMSSKTSSPSCFSENLAVWGMYFGDVVCKGARWRHGSKILFYVLHQANSKNNGHIRWFQLCLSLEEHVLTAGVKTSCYISI